MNNCLHGTSTQLSHMLSLKRLRLLAALARTESQAEFDERGRACRVPRGAGGARSSAAARQVAESVLRQPGREHAGRSPVGRGVMGACDEQGSAIQLLRGWLALEGGGCGGAGSNWAASAATDELVDISWSLRKALGAKPAMASQLLARVVRRMGDDDGMNITLRRVLEDDDQTASITTSLEEGPHMTSSYEPARLLLTETLQQLQLQVKDDRGRDAAKELDLTEDVRAFLAGSLYPQGDDEPDMDTLMTVVTSYEEALVVGFENPRMRDEVLFGLLVLLEAALRRAVIIEELPQ
ncbi:unnamed protein product [Symbiodinium natans]|uniref:Uncharacterized protein n=1 Tax=Symbiodinium natans TaxID=878477 RepID=A0A812S401_9DINO|nr:unnamed protein product [Symbiodinium natans]